MEYGIQLVIFLAFASVTVVTNALMIWFAYKAFARVTARVTETIREFETSDTTRQWLRTLERASQATLDVTARTKRKLSDFDPVLSLAQEQYTSRLARTDRTLAELGQELTTGATRMRDRVAKPAQGIGAFAAGLISTLGHVFPESDDTL
jgi:hypothetical protein